VVLLRGVNVGGHRTFRPARLAERLQHLGAINIGAAGTFVIRKPGGVIHGTLRIAGLSPEEIESHSARLAVAESASSDRRSRQVPATVDLSSSPLFFV
jgi:hypothetical protein